MHPLWPTANHKEMHTFELMHCLNKPGWGRLTQARQEQSLKFSEISSHFTCFCNILQDSPLMCRLVGGATGYITTTVDNYFPTKLDSKILFHN